jgi:acetolactate synthase-1/2/3 large subunit
MTAKVRLVDYLAGELARLGVSHVFGVGGANIEDFYGALHAVGGRGRAIQAVVCKHEFSAATMADGYARTTGRFGVATATSGGGAVNLVPGLAEAYASRVPLLALVGQPPTTGEGRGAFQDGSGKAGSLAAQELFTPVSRFCARVESADAIPALLAEALGAACGPVRGPAVLLLPKDIQRAPVAPRRMTPPAGPARPPEPAQLERAADLLGRARRVLVVAGEGVAASDARVELAEVAARLGAWVAVSPDAKDVFRNDDPRFAGVAGVMGHRNVQECLRQADACLLVGTRLPELARAGLDEALAAIPVVCIDPEPAYVPALAVLGPVRTALRALAERLGPPQPAPEHAGPVPTLTSPPHPAPPSGVLGHAAAVAAVQAALPSDCHVFVDAGNAGASSIHRLPAPTHGRFVVAVGMGGMGYTFGAGIGAALGTGKRTYVLAGDGSFFMHGMEIHTALEQQAPVTFVIFNNNAHAMCATREQLFLAGPHPSNLFHPADLAGGMAAMFPTLRVARATNEDELRQALLHSNSTAGTAFVAVDLDPAELPPFLPFIRTLQHEESSHAHAHAPVG